MMKQKNMKKDFPYLKIMQEEINTIRIIQNMNLIKWKKKLDK